MADHARLGHYLPYLLGRRLRAVVWPDNASERVMPWLLLVLLAGYGAGFGYVLNHQHEEHLAELVPKLVLGLNATWLTSTLLVDFLPALRPVTRPLPEHFPVSERHNVLTAFLLDFITLRRLLLTVFLLVAAAVAPRYVAVPGFTLLLVLSATLWSFNVRLLATLRRWRHPLLAGHVLSLALMGWWLLAPTATYAPALGAAMALPWLLGAAQLYWLGPRFAARYLPAEAAPAPSSSALGRLPLEWKAYLRKVWLPLLVGLAFKVLMLALTGTLLHGRKEFSQGFFYLALLPVISFTYVNNNLFAFLRDLTANEVLRLGLTPRVPALYFRLAGPIVLADCLVSAGLLLALFPASRWSLLGLLPLGAAALLSLGLWGSLYQAKPVIKAIDFANMRNNTSTLMSFLSIGAAAGLYFLPWWWVRIALALLIAASAAWPLRQAWRNDGELRRRLWQGIGA